MAMSPEEVRTKTFSVVRKGFARPEVHRFLDEVANQLQEFNRATATVDTIVVPEPAPRTAFTNNQLRAGASTHSHS